MTLREAMNIIRAEAHFGECARLDKLVKDKTQYVLKSEDHLAYRMKLQKALSIVETAVSATEDFLRQIDRRLK